MASSELFLVAGAFALVAVLMFVVVLRMTSAVPGSADGVIVNKTYRPAGTYTQVPVGIRRGMRTPTEIPIADSYVFEIRVDALAAGVFLALNTTASQSFQVGQRVRIRYRQRGVPFSSKPFLVLDMASAGPSPAPAPPAGP